MPGTGPRRRRATQEWTSSCRRPNPCFFSSSSSWAELSQPPYPATAATTSSCSDSRVTACRKNFLSAQCKVGLSPLFPPLASPVPPLLVHLNSAIAQGTDFFSSPLFCFIRNWASLLPPRCAFFFENNDWLRSQFSQQIGMHFVASFSRFVIPFHQLDSTILLFLSGKPLSFAHSESGTLGRGNNVLLPRRNRADGRGKTGFSLAVVVAQEWTFSLLGLV